MSERIDHVTEARNYIACWEEKAGQHPELDMALLQAHATLALVEQQRITNLIALAQGGRGGPIGLEEVALDALRSLHFSSDGPWGNQTVELRPEIREALGL